MLQYCHRWDTVLAHSLANYENLIYIVVNAATLTSKGSIDKQVEPLPSHAYPALVNWAKSIKTKDIRNFYLIFVQNQVCKVNSELLYAHKWNLL